MSNDYKAREAPAKAKSRLSPWRFLNPFFYFDNWLLTKVLLPEQQRERRHQMADGENDMRAQGKGLRENPQGGELLNYERQTGVETKVKQDQSKTLESLEQERLAGFNECSPGGKETSLSYLRNEWEHETEEDRIHTLKSGWRPLVEMAGVQIPRELLLKAGYDITELESQS